MATVQVQTSKPDVIIKVQVLDSEEEMVHSVGKGHAVVPAFYFISNERPLSSMCKYGKLIAMIIVNKETANTCTCAPALITELIICGIR